MTDDSVAAFQARLAAILRAIFGGDLVAVEWTSFRGEGARYSPRVDVAVGPFATGSARLESTFNSMVMAQSVLLRRLHACHEINVRNQFASDTVGDLESIALRNPNARCFMAIEIEKSGSRKHIMGGAINAAALGRLGMSVAWTEERLRALVKMRRYLLHLASVGKNSFDPTNLLILSRSQLEEIFEIAASGSPDSSPRGDSTNG
jgi:hypothetical protein